MTNEELLRHWVDAIEAHNQGKAGEWTVRFELDGAWLVERAVKRLDGIGVTMRSNGGPLERLVIFPRTLTREVATILVDEGARLCSDQTLAPVP